MDLTVCQKMPVVIASLVIIFAGIALYSWVLFRRLRRAEEALREAESHNQSA